MSPSLPWGRGSYSGPDNYQNQQESFDIRKELKPKKIGWVVRATELFTNLDNLAHTANLLSFSRLPIYNDTFELAQVRMRIVTNAGSKHCHTGLYVWEPSPVRLFRLIAHSVRIFSTNAVGLLIHDFENPVTIQAGRQYFSGAFVTDAGPQLLSGRAGTTVDEIVRTVSGVTELPKNMPLNATTATYTDRVILPSYYSAQAAEVV
jgi:hypothetical protein